VRARTSPARRPEKSLKISSTERGLEETGAGAISMRRDGVGARPRRRRRRAPGGSGWGGAQQQQRPTRRRRTHRSWDSAAFLASSPIFYYTPEHPAEAMFRSRLTARDAMPPRGALTLTRRARSVRFSVAPRGGEIRGVRVGDR